MPLKELLSSIDVKPKIALWVSILCLIIVLIDRQFYLSALQEREKNISELNAKLQVREDGNVKKEMTLRRWEMELMQREEQVSKMLDEIKAKSSPRAP